MKNLALVLSVLVSSSIASVAQASPRSDLHEGSELSFRQLVTIPVGSQRVELSQPGPIPELKCEFALGDWTGVAIEVLPSFVFKVTKVTTVDGIRRETGFPDQRLEMIVDSPLTRIAGTISCRKGIVDPMELRWLGSYPPSGAELSTFFRIR